MTDPFGSRTAPRVAQLGHVGIRVFDLPRQIDFYTRFLGLQVTDEAPDLGVVFLSSRPEEEHHELLLAKGRNVDQDAALIQQISFRCASLDDVITFYKSFVSEGVPLDMVVTHGNAVSIYFYDPEGNRCEVYWPTGMAARQPFVKNIDLTRDPEEILSEVRACVDEFGTTGYTEKTYVSWQRSHWRDDEAGEGANPLGGG